MRIRSVALGICFFALTIPSIDAATHIVSTTADSGAGGAGSREARRPGRAHHLRSLVLQINLATTIDDKKLLRALCEEYVREAPSD